MSVGQICLSREELTRRRLDSARILPMSDFFVPRIARSASAGVTLGSRTSGARAGRASRSDATVAGEDAFDRRAGVAFGDSHSVGEEKHPARRARGAQRLPRHFACLAGVPIVLACSSGAGLRRLTFARLRWTASSAAPARSSRSNPRTATCARWSSPTTPTGQEPRQLRLGGLRGAIQRHPGLLDDLATPEDCPSDLLDIGTKDDIRVMNANSVSRRRRRAATWSTSSTSSYGRRVEEAPGLIEGERGGESLNRGRPGCRGGGGYSLVRRPKPDAHDSSAGLIYMSEREAPKFVKNTF